jgi:GT2 family glycosyltransferase
VGPVEGALDRFDAPARGQAVREAPLAQPVTPVMAMSNAFEGLILSRGGGVLIVGWIDDRLDPVERVRVVGPGWRVTFEGGELARIRRADVETGVGAGASYAYGFFGLVFSKRPMETAGECRIEIDFKHHATIASAVWSRIVDDEELRNMALGYLASAAHFGNAHVKAIACVARGMGRELLDLNREIVGQIVASPYIERFGAQRARLAGSIAVCLYGRVEYFFLQMALYLGLPGIEDYEFVYVSNSPELAESLIKECRVASTIYDVRITLVLLPGNAGFGAANNAAASAASSDRILFVNPDVFPKDLDWARKHTDLIAAAPESQTRLFGVPLYYDDGSLMHGGMYFEMDSGVAFEGRRKTVWQLLRVEHYGKGAPPNDNPFLRARPAPAVTGAFISIDRQWFEKLGGFSVDYVFGHYEDADLCLKSLEAGAPAWLHDIRLWHLEGKGSTRLPLHEGGSLINRWVFSSRWGELISDGLLGRTPTRAEFAPPESEPEAAIESSPSQLGSRLFRRRGLQIGAPQ